MNDFDYGPYVRETAPGRFRLTPDGKELLDDVARGHEDLRVEHRVLLALLLHEFTYYFAIGEALLRWAEDPDSNTTELTKEIDELNETINRDSIEVTLP